MNSDGVAMPVNPLAIGGIHPSNRHIQCHYRKTFPALLTGEHIGGIIHSKRSQCA